MKLSESEWNFINEMALKVHSTVDEKAMRSEFLTLLQTLIKFDSASFYLYDDSCKSTAPVSINIKEESLTYYTEKLEDIDPFKPLRNLFSEPRHTAIRVSDYCLGTDIEDTEYYNVVWGPSDFAYSLFACLSYDGKPLGSISLYRKTSGEDFSDKDIKVMNLLKEHMNIRLWQQQSMKPWEAVKLQPVPAKQKEVPVKRENRYDLTGRELEVIEAWSRGLTDAEICDQLSISRNTLKKHISNIFSKLGIGSRVELLKIIPEIIN